MKLLTWAPRVAAATTERARYMAAVSKTTLFFFTVSSAEGGGRLAGCAVLHRQSGASGRLTEARDSWLNMVGEMCACVRCRRATAGGAEMGLARRGAAEGFDENRESEGGLAGWAKVGGGLVGASGCAGESLGEAGWWL